MHIHILGICGTFMGGLALIAKELGYKVTGSDQNVYPPMSTQLEESGIELTQGWGVAQLEPRPDIVIIGNALSRANQAVEYILNNSIPYTSGAQWLAENLLYKDCWVLAVAGTHGKSSTASMLAWILEYAGLTPGFLIGAVPNNFGYSARLGNKPFFVIEADEYDTAFFDKRSKFVHYHPRTLVMNNLEFDHADIFSDISAIRQQFAYLLRTVPSEGLVIKPTADSNLNKVVASGCWSSIEELKIERAAEDDSVTWQVGEQAIDGSWFDLFCDNEIAGRVEWQLLGQHNIANAVAAIAAARHAGVPVKHAIAALSEFQGIKRRLEVRGKNKGYTVYDDFAHHPTAIKTTIAGLRKKVGAERVIAILEPRSNTMRMGSHKGKLAEALSKADAVFILHSEGTEWNLQDELTTLISEQQIDVVIKNSIDELLKEIKNIAIANDHLLVMSNGAFGNIHEKLLHG